MADEIVGFNRADAGDLTEVIDERRYASEKRGSGPRGIVPPHRQLYFRVVSLTPIVVSGKSYYDGLRVEFDPATNTWVDKNSVYLLELNGQTPALTTRYKGEPVKFIDGPSGRLVYVIAISLLIAAGSGFVSRVQGISFISGFSSKAGRYVVYLVAARIRTVDLSSPSVSMNGTAMTLHLAVSNATFTMSLFFFGGVTSVDSPTFTTNITGADPNPIVEISDYNGVTGTLTASNSSQLDSVNSNSSGDITIGAGGIVYGAAGVLWDGTPNGAFNWENLDLSQVISKSDGITSFYVFPGNYAPAIASTYRVHLFNLTPNKASPSATCRLMSNGIIALT